MTDDQIITAFNEYPKSRVLRILLSISAILPELIKIIRFIGELIAQEKLKEENEKLFGKMRIVNEDRPAQVD